MVNADMCEHDWPGSGCDECAKKYGWGGKLSSEPPTNPMTLAGLKDVHAFTVSKPALLTRVVAGEKILDYFPGYLVRPGLIYAVAPSTALWVVEKVIDYGVEWRWVREADTPLAKDSQVGLVNGAKDQKAEGDQMTEDQITHMVNRFLQWKLPEDFSPDGGIMFRQWYDTTAPWGVQKNEPVGTNLFNHTQAKEMVKFMLEGMPGVAALAAFEEIRASLKRINDKLPEREGPRPRVMDHAPKDGTPVLAWTDHEGWIVVKFWVGNGCWAPVRGGDEVFPRWFYALPPAMKELPNG